MEFLIVYLISGLIFGLISRYLANNKGYDGGFWWGFFLGIIGVVVVGLRRDLSSSTYYANNSIGSGEKGYLNRIASEDKMRKESSSWFCLHCGSKNPGSLNYCLSCRSVREEDHKWVCSCGATNKMTHEACWVCQRLKNEPSEPTTQQTNIDKSSLGQNENNTWGCTTCKQNNIDEAKFCMSCGTKRPSESNTDWRCSDCGILNKPIGRFCIQCGKTRQD